MWGQTTYHATDEMRAEKSTTRSHCEVSDKPLLSPQKTEEEMTQQEVEITNVRWRQ